MDAIKTSEEICLKSRCLHLEHFQRCETEVPADGINKIRLAFVYVCRHLVFRRLYCLLGNYHSFFMLILCVATGGQHAQTFGTLRTEELSGSHFQTKSSTF